MGNLTSIYGTCHIAFGDTWQTSPQTWTDVTGYLRQFDLSWGRGSEYDQFRAGTCAIELDNRDGRFTPENTGSPYTPNVIPWVPIRAGIYFTDGVGETAACLFSGFVERWVLSYPGFGADATVQVQATDGMKIPAQYQVTITTASTTPGGMIDDVLDAFGWSTGTLWRTIDAGAAGELRASTLSKTAALSGIQTIVNSDGGYFYSMPHSTALTPRLVFRDRLWPSENNTITATFGETSTQVGYRDVALTFDEERIRNRWSVGIAASTKLAVQNDTGSQDKYGLRVQSMTGLLLKTTAEADDRALDGVHTTATPAVGGTVTSMLRKGMDYDRAVDLAVDAYGPLRWVTVVRGDVDKDMIVDGCAVSYQVGGYPEFTYSMSPASLSGTYWLLGDATYGKLDVTTYLGW